MSESKNTTRNKQSKTFSEKNKDTMLTKALVSGNYLIDYLSFRFRISFGGANLSLLTVEKSVRPFFIFIESRLFVL